MYCQPANWASVAFLLVVGGAAVIYYRYQQDKLQNTIRIETIGTPLLGGPFNLVDDTGKVSRALLWRKRKLRIDCMGTTVVSSSSIVLPFSFSPGRSCLTPQRVSSESLKGKYILLYFGQIHLVTSRSCCAGVRDGIDHVVVLNPC